MSEFKIAKVIVKSPLWRDFDYLLPEALDISVGQRVVVPFGKRKVVGIVSHLNKASDIDPEKLKPITDVLDEQPVLDASLIRLYEWASDYYHYPLGEVVFGGLPKKLREVRSVPLPAKTETQTTTIENPTDLTLSQPQQQAIEHTLQLSGFGCVLLHGVTGSGKTEVYLQVISDCLRCKRQALILVPEISLTPQTLARFEKRFNVPIVSLHSGLTDTQRLKSWFAMQMGAAQILIGTRSAIFTPIPNLGVIILDEEHDASFKQQSGFRYSARDVAVMRAHIAKVPVILGSATPSLESLYNAWDAKRYDYVSLPDRAGDSKPPRIEIVDIKRERLNSGLSAQLLAKIDQHLAAKGQVLLFLNRRGFAPVMMCHHCGYAERCHACDTFLTYHQASRELRCHHCDSCKIPPKYCSQCQQADLIPVGMGTERLEEMLSALYGEKNVIRIDRDTTRRKGALEHLLEEAHSGSSNILIGTQMLAKGHHFKNLTLVAVIDADSGLFSTDFRAIERLAQLLVQVAGRAGRGIKQGEVLIQTHHPEHPMLQTLLKSGYSAFAKELLAQRKEAALPPHEYMALFRSEDKDEHLPMNFLSELKQQLYTLTQDPNIDVLGPIEAPMPRRAGKFRAQLLLRSANRPQLQNLLDKLMSHDFLRKQKRSVQWSLDVDPAELF